MTAYYIYKWILCLQRKNVYWTRAEMCWSPYCILYSTTILNWIVQMNEKWKKKQSKPVDCIDSPSLNTLQIAFGEDCRFRSFH